MVRTPPKSVWKASLLILAWSSPHVLQQTELLVGCPSNTQGPLLLWGMLLSLRCSHNEASFNGVKFSKTQSHIFFLWGRVPPAPLLPSAPHPMATPHPLPQHGCPSCSCPSHGLKAELFRKKGKERKEAWFFGAWNLWESPHRGIKRAWSHPRWEASPLGETWRGPHNWTPPSSLASLSRLLPAGLPAVPSQWGTPPHIWEVAITAPPHSWLSCKSVQVYSFSGCPPTSVWKAPLLCPVLPSAHHLSFNRLSPTRLRSHPSPNQTLRSIRTGLGVF